MKRLLLLILISFGIVSQLCAMDVGNKRSASEAFGEQELAEELVEAIRQKSIEGVARAIGLGANVNYVFDGHIVPLHLAAHEGCVGVVRLLISNGADVGARDNNGNAPLHLAAYKGQVDVAKLLISNGADKEAKNNDGNTPLHLATFYGQVEAARLLISNRADKEAKDNFGYTPLHLAAENGHVEAAGVLLSSGAGKDTRSNNGYTPLHLAAYKGHVEATKILLIYGADYNITDEDDLSANGIASDMLLGQDLLDDSSNNLRKVIEILESPNPYRHPEVLEAGRKMLIKRHGNLYRRALLDEAGARNATTRVYKKKQSKLTT